MVRRVSEEIEGYVVELGADGRLVMLQLEELVGGVEEDRRLVAKDYFRETIDFELLDVMNELAALDDDSLLDLHDVAAVLRLGPGVNIDSALQPRASASCTRSCDSPRSCPIMWSRGSPTCRRSCAGLADLTEVDGVGEVRACAIKEGLSRLAETSILERYV